MWFSVTCSKGVEEEKELANSCADVERVEGLLEPIQLRQSGDQLQDVVLQILQQTSVSLSKHFFFFFLHCSVTAKHNFLLAEKSVVFVLLTDSLRWPCPATSYRLRPIRV